MSRKRPSEEFQNLRYFTKAVLPTVYDESLSYYELLNKVILYLNELVNNVNAWNEYLNAFLDIFEDNLREEVKNKIEEMYNSGEFGDIVNAFLDEKTEMLDNKLKDFREALDKLDTKLNGDITTAIEDIQSQMNSLDTSVNSKITNLENTVNEQISNIDTSVNEKITNFQNSVNTDITNFKSSINETVSVLQNNIKDIKEENVSFFKITKNLLLKDSDDLAVITSISGSPIKDRLNTGAKFYGTSGIDNIAIIRLNESPKNSVKVKFKAKKLTGSNSSFKMKYMNTDDEKTINLTSEYQNFELNLNTPPMSTIAIYITYPNIVFIISNLEVTQDIEFNYVDDINYRELVNRSQNWRNVSNSASTIDKIVQIASDYDKNINNTTYYNNYTLYDYESKKYNGKVPLDCSSYVLALITGVSYDNQNIVNGRKNIKSEWGFNSYPTDKARFTYLMAKWCINNGYAFIPNDDFSNLQAGDILFHSNQKSGDNQYLNIHHVAMFLGKFNNNSMLLTHYYSTTSTYRNPPTTIEYRNIGYYKDFTLCARLPLGDVSSDWYMDRYHRNDIGFTLNSSNRSKNIIAKEDLVGGKMYTLTMKNYKTSGGSNDYVIIQMFSIDLDRYVQLYTDGSTGYDGSKDRIIRFYVPRTVEGSSIGESYVNVQLPGLSSGSVSCDSYQIVEGFSNNI